LRPSLACSGATRYLYLRSKPLSLDAFNAAYMQAKGMTEVSTVGTRILTASRAVRRVRNKSLGLSKVSIKRKDNE
jgi:hypothetical protein